MKQDTFNTVTDVLKLKSVVCNDPTSNWQAPQEPAITKIIISIGLLCVGRSIDFSRGK